MGMRKALPKTSTGFILVLEFLATIVATIFFGLDLWIPVLFAVVLWWMLAQYQSPALAMIACNLVIGIAFAELLFGLPPPWVSSMLGTLAVAFVSLGFMRGGNPEGGERTQDPSVIPIFIAMIATRAFLALKYATIHEISFSLNPLQWVTLFVFGAVPGAPVILNTIFVVALQGSLVIYLVLILKRLANPLAY